MIDNIGNVLKYKTIRTVS